MKAEALSRARRFLAAQPPASGMKEIPSRNRRYGIEIPDF
jgi:hypothetical protein